MTKLVAAMTVLMLSPIGLALNETGPEGKARQSSEWLERTWLVDANYDFAISITDPQHYSYSRGRLGIARFQEPRVYSLGVTARAPHTSRPVSLGLEAEHMSMKTSTWIQVGADMKTTGTFRATLGAGWQIFGLDAHFSPGVDEWGVGGKVRVPITWIVEAVK